MNGLPKIDYFLQKRVEDQIPRDGFRTIKRPKTPFMYFAESSVYSSPAISTASDTAI